MIPLHLSLSLFNNTKERIKVIRRGRNMAEDWEKFLKKIFEGRKTGSPDVKALANYLATKKLEFGDEIKDNDWNDYLNSFSDEMKNTKPWRDLIINKYNGERDKASITNSGERSPKRLKIEDIKQNKVLLGEVMKHKNPSSTFKKYIKNRQPFNHKDWNKVTLTSRQITDYNHWVEETFENDLPSSTHDQMVSSFGNAIAILTSKLFGEGTYNVLRDTKKRKSGTQIPDFGVCYKNKICFDFEAKTGVIWRDHDLGTNGTSYSTGAAAACQLFSRWSTDERFASRSFAMAFNGTDCIFFEYLSVGEESYELIGPAHESFQFFEKSSWKTVENYEQIPEVIKMIIYALMEAAKINAQAEIGRIWSKRPKNFQSEYFEPVHLYNRNNEVIDYILTDLVGLGSRSFVFRASKVGSDRAVCIKMTHEDGRVELENEEFILTLLKGVVGVPLVLDYGALYLDEKKMVALVTNVVGISVTEFTKNHLLTTDDIEDIWNFTQSIFSDIHRRKVVVADFKPEHIIIAKEGIFVVDFGGSYQSGCQHKVYLVSSMFASYSAMNLRELKAQDDLESLTLSAIYLIDTAAVPWWNGKIDEVREQQSRSKASCFIQNKLKEKPAISELTRELGVVLNAFKEIKQ
eukprot:TRINITY_DN2428_c0_g1_i1.p1 TRINITY_DN2428_c0_g1~~TRINITY_DN2428_c0_g1_i1.p1  ORF type:complete len:632 (-),score=64.60 TRINITY_DN2428_c0_g1_i1:68-1963(-)